MRKATDSLERINVHTTLLICFIFQWAVLHCGHCYCCDCMSVLQTRNPSPDMRCPVCRQTTARKEVSFVSTDQRSEERSSETDIKVHVRQKNILIRKLVAYFFKKTFFHRIVEANAAVMGICYLAS